MLDMTPPSEAMVLLDHALQHLNITCYNAVIRDGSGLERFRAGTLYLTPGRIMENGRVAPTPTWSIWLEWHDDRWMAFRQKKDMHWETVYEGPVLGK